MTCALLNTKRQSGAQDNAIAPHGLLRQRRDVKCGIPVMFFSMAYSRSITRSCTRTWSRRACRLRDLPIDCIKIDRKFVGLADQEAMNALYFIYQLTRLGHSLGKSVVLEGVESEDLLRAATCTARRAKAWSSNCSSCT